MKTMKYIIPMLFALLFTSCEMDLPNPNAATDTQVLNTKDGLYALAIGIQSEYSVSALQPVLLTPSVTTRETAIMTTFANLEELEQGGAQLSGENGYTSRLFSRLMRVKGMSEDLIGAADNINASEQVKANLKSWGNLFRAMSLGYLANNYEQVALVNSPNNDAVFSDRMDAYAEAVRLLQENINLIASQGVSSEFTTAIASSIDVLNTSRLYLARYQLILGNYDEAIAAANAVDKSSKSEFKFDNQNQNPVYLGMFDGTVSYAPRDMFGLPESEFTIDANDMRTSFFMQEDDGLSLNNLPVNIMVAPFFNSNISSIPVYVPGEAYLIVAEAQARKNNYSQAETALNMVLSKQPADDIFGLGAGLSGNFTANGNKEALLKEIYKNRRIELFLTGQSLEDSRRFNRPEPQEGYTSERNRNFYPYDADERLNNTNTPPNPAI